MDMGNASPAAPGEGKHLASIDELSEGKTSLGTIGRHRFLVVRYKNKIHVCSNICPHKGAALHEGLVLGTEIVCPCHQGRFDLDTGVPKGPPARDDLTVYEIAISSGSVRVVRPRPPQRWHIRKGIDKRQIVILGAGAAGSAAAESLRREGFDGRILLIGAEQELPYDRTTLSKGFLKARTDGVAPAQSSEPQVADKEIAGLQLRPLGFYEQAEIDVLLGEEAVGVEPARKAVFFRSGKELRYDSLLLATGGNPRRSGVSAEYLSGVLTLRSHQDAVRIKQAVASAQSVVIMGAGFLGLEMANSISCRGLPVTIVSAENLPLKSVFGERIAHWLVARHREQGVSFCLGKKVRELRGRHRISDVLLEDGTLLPAQVVIEAIGIQPATDFLVKSGLAKAGGIPVDSRQATAAPDIFAAGDLALVQDQFGKLKRFEHWVDAETQGRHAARALVGMASPIENLHFFWTEGGCHTLKFLGAVEPNASAVVRGCLEESNFLAGYYRTIGDKPRLIGACAVGRDRELIAAGEHIRLGLPLTQQELSDESVDLADRLQKLKRSEQPSDRGSRH
jgi:apoptosis-inducing factor 3